jgi:hypothetical protein
MTNQSDRQQSCRNVTGTALNYEGDWHALWDVIGIPVGEYESRMLAYINLALNTTYTELNGAMAAYAIANGVTDWNSLGTFTPGPYPFAGSSQAFNFAGTTGMTPLAGSPATFSRGTNATMYRQGDGWLVYGPNNQFLYSNDFSNTWNANNTVSITQGYSDPFGGNNAWFQIPNTANVSHPLQQSINFVAGQTYTFSIYAKGGEGGYLWARLNLSNAAFPAGTQAWFNVGSSNPGVGTVGGNVTSTSFLSIGNGWYRIGITATCTNTAAGFASIVIANADSATSFAGDGIRGIYYYGAQFELGPYMQAYNPTTSVAYYGPRLDTNPTTLLPRGYLSETQSTNLLTYSNDFNNAAWTKVDIVVTSNSTISPEGIQNSDLITEGSAGNANLYQISSAFTAGASVAYSGYYKRGNSDWIRMTVTEGVGGVDGGRVWFNLATGSIGTNQLFGAGSGLTSSIIPLPNGWYRCSMVVVINGTTTTAQALTVSAQGDGNVSRVNNATRYQYGSQFEVGLFSSSYIPTLASTATRAADVLTAPWTIYPEFSMYVKYETYGTATTRGGLVVSDGTLNNRAGIRPASSSNTSSQFVIDGGVSQVSSNVGTTSANIVYKSAARFRLNDFAVTRNGGAVVTDTSGTIPSGLTTLYIGNENGIAQLSGWIYEAAIYPTGLANTQLQSITT